MATGLAVNTGDTITAAKMNLKQETGADLANLSVLDTGADHSLAFVCNENLSANRNLNFVVNNAARTIDLTGNLTLAANFTTTTGAITLVGDAGGSSITLPASGTVATLAGTETLSGKTLTLAGSPLNMTAGGAFVIGTTDNFSVTVKTNNVNKFVFTTTLGQFTVNQTTANLTVIFSDPGAARNITFPDPGGHDSVVYLAATQTLSGKTLSLGGNLTFASALDLVIQSNTTAAFEMSDGTTKYLKTDTRTATDNVAVHLWTVSAPTFASAAGSTFIHHSLAAYTVTLTGGVAVTAMDGIQLYVGTGTITSAAATTVTTASAVYLKKLVAGGSVTFSNNYIINTDVAGCFLTAAGVWTDASSGAHKTDIRQIDVEEVMRLLGEVEIYSYRRKDPSDGGFRRFGFIAERAPDFVATPSHDGVSANYMAGFALAAIKSLREQVNQLEKELDEIKK